MWEVRYNPYHDNKGRFAKSPHSSSKKNLTKSGVNVKLDSKGKPFKFETVQLPQKEYAEVMSEIGRWWHAKYDGVEFCRMDFTDKTYYFENRGIGDYNIYNVRRNKK